MTWYGVPQPKRPKVPRKRARTWVKKRSTERRKRTAEVIAEVRELVFRLDRTCAVCGKAGRASDEMHEVIPRSKTRGKPPEERFNRRNCVRLHSECHRAVTEKVVKMAFVDAALGVDGGLVMDWDGATRRRRRYERHNDKADQGHRQEADDPGNEEAGRQ